MKQIENYSNSFLELCMVEAIKKENIRKRNNYPESNKGKYEKKNGHV